MTKKLNLNHYASILVPNRYCKLVCNRQYLIEELRVDESRLTEAEMLYIYFSHFVKSAMSRLVVNPVSPELFARSVIKTALGLSRVNFTEREISDEK